MISSWWPQQAQIEGYCSPWRY